MGWLPAQRTPLAPEQAARAIAQASGLRGRALALAIAHSALETDQWKQLHNFNFGYTKPAPGQDFTTLKTAEVIDGKLVWFSPEGQLASKDGPVVGQRWKVPPGHPQSRFNAYGSPAAGAAGWWARLTSPRYAAALEQLRAGTAKGYAEQLGRAGYFTANPGPYGEGIEALQRQFEPLARQIAGSSGKREATGRRSGAGAVLLLVASAGALAMALRRKKAF